MPADIFADTSTVESLDTSSEALEDSWEEDTSQREPESSVEETDDTQDESDDDEVPVSSEENNEEESDDDEDSDDDDGAIPDSLKGKTPAELAKMVSDAQSHVGRQANEVGELRKLVEQQQEQLQELAMAAAASYDDGIDTSGWIDDLQSNPQAVYAQALDLLDRGQIDIAQMEEVIDAASELHPKLGRTMARDFDRRLIAAQMAQEIEPVQQRSYENTVTQVSGEMWNSPDPEIQNDIREYHEEISSLLANVDLGKSPKEVRSKLEQALTVVRGSDPTRSFKYKQALAALKAESTVEEGTVSPKDAVMTEADKMRDSVFNRRKRDPAAALFADL